MMLNIIQCVLGVFAVFVWLIHKGSFVSVIKQCEMDTRWNVISYDLQLYIIIENYHCTNPKEKKIRYLISG